MDAAFPILIIAIGLAVLALGKRVAVLGAAVGAIVGVALLGLFNLTVTENLLLALLLPGGLAALGFFAAGFAKGIIKIVLLVFGALAGAAIVFAFLNLFSLDWGFWNWILALVGGVVGLVLIRRFDEWGIIILSGIIGALLVTRGLTDLLGTSENTVLSTLMLLVLAGGSIFYQGGFFARRKEKQAAAAKAATPPSATPAQPAVSSEPPPTTPKPPPAG